MNISDTRQWLLDMKSNSARLKGAIQGAWRENHQNYPQEVEEEFRALLLGIASDLSTCEMTWWQLKRPFAAAEYLNFNGPHQLKQKMAEANNV